MNQLIYLNALNQITVLGPKRTFRLLKICHYNAEFAWKNDYLLASPKLKIPRNAITSYLEQKKHIDPEQEWQKLQKYAIQILVHPKLWPSGQTPITAYPYLLSTIAQPPPILYLKGRLEATPLSRMAVIGSRRATRYGLAATANIVADLAAAGVEIVSGLALGIDAAAHESCLKSKSPTIAVLANGLDEIYPRTNARLAAKIIQQNGAVISEFPIGTPPLRQHFPQRNRLISGLCQALIIVQASLKSGSLITAAHALEQNRDIYAVPGDIFSQAFSGTNNLIKQGAKLITSAQDILSDIGLAKSLPKNLTPTALGQLPSSPLQQKIYDALAVEPKSADELIKKIKASAHEINANLSLMEIKGLIRNSGSGRYTI